MNTSIRKRAFWERIARSAGMRSFCCGVLIFVLGFPKAWGWTPIVWNGRCKEGGNKCLTTIGNEGAQNSCCDPSNPGNYSSVPACARRNVCTGGIAYRWKTLPISWFWNPNGLTGGFWWNL
ncbi:MAG: hypothetical protein AAGJ35_00960 [Myxococcota bacterium]